MCSSTQYLRSLGLPAPRGDGELRLVPLQDIPVEHAQGSAGDVHRAPGKLPLLDQVQQVGLNLTVTSADPEIADSAAPDRPWPAGTPPGYSQRTPAAPCGHRNAFVVRSCHRFPYDASSSVWSPCTGDRI